MTWRALDKITGFDFGVERAFERGAYRKKDPVSPILKIASLTSSRVVDRPLIATPPVVESRATTTPDVAIPAILPPSPTTPDVDPLEVAISGVEIKGRPIEVEPALKGETAGGPLQKAAQRNEMKKMATPATCQYPDCSTLTLGREFCSKHRDSSRGIAMPLRPAAREYDRNVVVL